VSAYHAPTAATEVRRAFATNDMMRGAIMRRIGAVKWTRCRAYKEANTRKQEMHGQGG
jgi:hypothetical protein